MCEGGGYENWGAMDTIACIHEGMHFRAIGRFGVATRLRSVSFFAALPARNSPVGRGAEEMAVGRGAVKWRQKKEVGAR